MLVNGNGFRESIRPAGEIPLLLCLFVVLLAVGWLGIPTCPVRYFGDRPCPTCGTTRSVASILSGNFAQAWKLNPIGYIVVLAFAKRCAQLFGQTKLRRMLDCQTIDVILLTAFLTTGMAKSVGWI